MVRSSYVKKGYAKREKHGLWKGDEAAYSSVHDWLRANFGNARKCENRKCPKISKNYEWALIHGSQHGHHRKRYRQLCRSCHRIYDKINLKNEH